MNTPDQTVRAAVERALARDGARSVDAPLTATRVLQALQDSPSVAVVPVKSAAASKINWTQAIAVLASILVIFGIDLDLQTQLAIVAAIQGAQAAITWVLRTWFTRSVTPASVGK